MPRLLPRHTIAVISFIESQKIGWRYTHLTTGGDFRGKGVARLLADQLKERSGSYPLGISLRCRRDYNINDMWQGFGFTVRHSKEGRGADGALLDYWWFDHKHEDLFSQAVFLA